MLAEKLNFSPQNQICVFFFDFTEEKVNIKIVSE